jgi:hypothetical protein
MHHEYSITILMSVFMCEWVPFITGKRLCGRAGRVGVCRWLEAASLYHSLVRLLFCCACALRWLVFPVNYALPARLGIDTAVDLLFETPSHGVSDVAHSRAQHFCCAPVHLVMTD